MPEAERKEYIYSGYFINTWKSPPGGQVRNVLLPRKQSEPQVLWALPGREPSQPLARTHGKVTAMASELLRCLLNPTAKTKAGFPSPRGKNHPGSPKQRALAGYRMENSDTLNTSDQRKAARLA